MRTIKNYSELHGRFWDLDANTKLLLLSDPSLKHQDMKYWSTPFKLIISDLLLWRVIKNGNK